jgi:type IV secretory pathway VirB10-like protein
MTQRATAIFGIVLLIVITANSIAAQVRYKDNEGVTHWVNSIDDVPAQFRSSAIGKPVQPTSPSSSPSIDWDQRARELDQQRERERQEADRQDEKDRAARQAREDQQRAANERQRAADELQQSLQELNALFAKAVGICRDRVQSGSGRPTQYSSGFQAFISTPGHVQMLGSAQARFDFTKCMRDAGQAVE